MGKAETQPTDSHSSLDDAKSDEMTPLDSEGGWAGWTAVLGAFLVQFCGFGMWISYGVFQDFYTRVYLTNSTPSTIAWVGSLNGCLGSVGGLLAGRLHDRGHFYHLMIGGSVLSSFSLFMLSLARPNCFYQILLTQGLGLGLGTGAMYVPSLAIMSHHFKRKRTLAMSIAASGAPFGAMVHPIIMNKTLNGRLGFAGGTRLLAGIVTLLLAIACSLMRTKPSKKAPLSLGVCLRRFCKDRAYVVAVIGSFCFGLAYNFPLFFLQLDAIKHGLSKDFAFYILVILSAASFIGRILTGLLVHKFDTAKLVTMSMACCGFVIFGMIGVKEIPGIVSIAVLYGFFSGIYFALQAPLFVLLSEDQMEIGLRVGIGLTFLGGGVLLGGPIHGATLGESYVWWRPAVFSGLACVSASVLFLTTNVILHRRRRDLKPSPSDTEALSQGDEQGTASRNS